MKQRSTAAVVVASVAAAAGAAAASPAYANTRDSANSYINTRTNINTVPGAMGYYWANAGVGVWMDCWTQGPVAMGQSKWFKITVRNGTGYGLVGYVPAPAVSNQWTSAPLCPPW